MKSPRKKSKASRKSPAASKSAHPSHDTRSSLLKAAVRVFAQKGYEGATVKDISKEADVNVSLVSYYFEGKENLYRACLEEFGRSRLAIAESLLTQPESYQDLRVKLKLWIQQNLDLSAKERDLGTIVHRDSNFESNLGRDVFKNVFMKIFNALHDFFEAGRKKGILRSDVNTLLMASAFHGAIIHIVRYNHLGKDFFDFSIENPAHRQLLNDQMIDLFLLGATAKETL